MEKTTEPKPKKNDPVIHVSLHEDKLNNLLFILEVIKESDTFGSMKDRKQAEKILDVIHKYKKTYKREDGKHYTICLFESQIAAMIRFFADTVEMIMPPEENTEGS